MGFSTPGLARSTRCDNITAGQRALLRALSHTHTHSYMHTLSYTHTLSLSHTHTHSLTLLHTHSFARAHTHTLCSHPSVVRQVLPPLDPVPSCATVPTGGTFANGSMLPNGTLVSNGSLVLPPCQIYTQDACGWIGFVATCAVVLGGFVGGWAADVVLAPKRRMKSFLVVSSLLMVLCTAYFSFALPLPFPLPFTLPSTEATVLAGIVLAALFMGAASPVYYELGVEMTHPQPEVIS